MKICLFDLDSTLADYIGALSRDLQKIQSPTDPPFEDYLYVSNEPDWFKVRVNLIRSQRDWWANLEPLQLGFDVYNLAKKIGYKKYVLTKAPASCIHAWTEKAIWSRKSLDADDKIIVTEDKAVTYGRVLVDDYEPYIKAWLKFRPRGLVIMPATKINHHFTHPQVIRYDGSNLQEVESAMQTAYER